VLTGWTPAVPVLIENTAGGSAGSGRTLHGITRLWAGLRDAGLIDGVGLCLDTCHAWAAGLALPSLVDQLVPVVGRIDRLCCVG
jgi:deoxyribonuclease-4